MEQASGKFRSGLGYLFLLLAALLFPFAGASAASQSAWFWLSSDQIRALRDVSPASVLVFKWSRHSDVLPPGPGEGEPVHYPHPDASGTLVIGPDYVVIDESTGETSIYDFRLDRAFRVQAGKADFENQDLLALMFLRDEEAFNRTVQGKIFEVIGTSLPLGVQPYYEAELGARTRTLAPIQVTLSAGNGETTASYKGEAIASFKEGPSPLTAQQAQMFARALRYFEFVHPAAVDAIMPLKNALSEATGVHASGGEKLRTTIRFEPPSADQRPYPLPAGLHAQVHTDQGSSATYVNRLVDIGLNATSGAAGPKPSRDEYFADESRSYASGDLLGTGLASFAMTTHYPDEPQACASSASDRCDRELADFQAAARDPDFRRIVQASEICSRQPEEAAKLVSQVDVSREKHGYMANYLMYCALRQISSERARQIVGGSFVPSAADNMIRALTSNPFIPALYFDAGMGLLGNWDASGWRLIEIGEALGGGTAKGDAYDKDFNRLKQDIMTRYPERF